jgi:hypothetical protein
MRQLVIAGALAGGKEAAWVAQAMNAAGTAGEPWSVVGYVDDDATKHGLELAGHRVLGTAEAIASRFTAESPWFACVIGDNAAREQVAARLARLGWKPATLIHPSASIGPGVAIGEGTYVAPGVIVSVDAKLGRFVLLNYGASVGHDAVLDDFSQACPGSRVNGWCHLARGAFVGSNAALLPRVRIGEGAKVGANAAVTRDVEAGTTVVGVPAKRVK